MKQYNPKKVSISVRGFQITGFAEGTFVSIKKAQDRFKKKVGTDGEVVRSLVADESGEIEITLMHTSASNNILDAISREDRLLQTGVFPVQIKDISGTTIFTCAQAWIQKDPDQEFGDDAGSRTWVLAFADNDANSVIGGNLI